MTTAILGFVLAVIGFGLALRGLLIALRALPDLDRERLATARVHALAAILFAISATALALHSLGWI